MDIGFCDYLKKNVTSKDCLKCSYALLQFTIDPDDVFCGFVPFHPDVVPPDNLKYVPGL